MINSIFVALSGMKGHERGLNVISNNIANMNTLGFRGSTLSFSDVFSGAPSSRSASQQGQGGGLDSSLTLVDFRTGEAAQTDRRLDLRLDGAGFFVVQNEKGEVRYTRAGSFEFDADGVLVVRGEKLKVMSRNGSGQLLPIELKSLRFNPPKATSEVVLDGSLSEGDTTHTIDGVKVFDKDGDEHTLRLEFRKPAEQPASDWQMQVFEGLSELGSGTVRFLGPRVDPGSSPLRLTLMLPDGELAEIAFDFADVDRINTGAESDLAFSKQDGFTAGQLTVQAFNEQTFDADGVLQLRYSNGQTVNGAQLALAQFGDEAGLQQVGDALFDYQSTQPVVLRVAGADLRVVNGALERSNVNLTEEFSELILTQRGFQASSQVLSTANDMLQELLELRNRR